MMKTCTKCLVAQPFTLFSKSEHASDGLQYVCKQCRKLYRVVHADHMKVYQRDWYFANKDAVKESASRWAKANPQKVKEIALAYYYANKEKVGAARAVYRAANLEKHRIYQQTRRACKVNAGGKLSPGLSASIFKLQQGKCACGCKQPLGEGYHLDHVMPLSLGGSNTDENIQLLRATCNLRKGMKHPVGFMQSRGFLL